MIINKRLILLVVMLLVSAVLLVQGCGSLSPKLSSDLQNLIEAERQGEAESYAERRGIDLVGSKIMVIVECFPDLIEEAVDAARILGTVEQEPIVREDYVYPGMVLLIPITNLNDMAKEKSVRQVVIPTELLPQ